MSTMKRASTVDGLKRGMGTAAAAVPGQDAAAPPEAPQRPRPEKPVRFTLDLDRARHRFLKTYAAGIEADGAAEVMRALLDELRDDAELAGRIRARVWASR